MDSRTQPASDRVYEDFEPFYEWDRDERLVNVMLPGYTRDQLKVQVTSKPTLRLIGERLIFGNRWRRFNLELPILPDYDIDNVTAKFEGGKLSIKFGKLLKPKETTTPSQKVEQPKPAQEDNIPKAKDREEEKTNGEVPDQKTPQQEETKTETTDSTDKAAQDGLSETKEAPTPKAPPKTRPVSRSKTRLIDFTLSFGPNRGDNEANGDLDAGKNKWKKLVKLMMLILLVAVLVGLGVYARNAFTSSNGESEIESYFQEL